MTQVFVVVPGLPVPNKPEGFCRHKAVLKRKGRNWLWWCWSCCGFGCHSKKQKQNTHTHTRLWLKGLKVFSGSWVHGHGTVGVGCRLWRLPPSWFRNGVLRPVRNYKKLKLKTTTTKTRNSQSVNRRTCNYHSMCTSIAACR